MTSTRIQGRRGTRGKGRKIKYFDDKGIPQCSPVNAVGMNGVTREGTSGIVRNARVPSGIRLRILTIQAVNLITALWRVPRERLIVVKDPEPELTGE